ncbi:MAG: lytic transglycosylase domain-containing protein [Neptuniibacter sp.]|nr:lytic transglycosylase domain-containing protein [Neptuniibacter sp.]
MLQAGFVYSDQIRKIVHPDGRVEYTNLSDKQRQIHFTNKSGSSTKSVYKFRNEEGVLAFSDQRPVNLNFEVLRFDCYACRVNSTVDWYNTPLNTKAYRSTVKTMADKYGVEEALVRAVIHAESAFRKDAVSKAGAQGLMQLMPATAKDLGVTNPFSPQQNIEGGTKYLAALLENFSGDITLATAAYNAGPGAVSRYKGIPPYKETQAYVERVAILRNRYAQQL